MSFTRLIEELRVDTLGSDDRLGSLALFRPELVLCAIIVLVLLARLVGLNRYVSPFLLTFVGSLVALVLAIAAWQQGVGTEQGHEFIHRQEFFTGMLVFDGMTVYFRTILLMFLTLFILFTRITGVPDRDAAVDIYPLVVGATLGMCLMVEANHLLIVFLGVEMASVPSYVLAGMLKGRRRASEAALKYAVYGAGTAGVMLYGISLLGGVLDSYHLPTMAAQLGELLAADPSRTLGADKPLVLMIGGLMLMVGLAFKLSAVPFHFWCPDVFEGATAEVNAFLSVASKAAALALLVRVAVGLGTLPPHHDPAEQGMYAVADGPNAVNDAGANPTIDKSDIVPNQDLIDDEPSDISGMSADSVPPPIISRLAPAQGFIWRLIGFLAAITCTFGNLAAYGQTNIKRLLAYSTIAHAGYMMMAVAAALALADTDPVGAQQALSALAFYIGVYVFMNLGAFAIVAILRNAMGSEEIADYAGLIRQAPITVICFALILVSLIGIPPLGGFVGKFLVFASLMRAHLLMLLAIGGLNTGLSLFYYLRVVKVMTMDPEPEQRLPVQIPFISGVFLVALTLPVVVLGIGWDGLNSWATEAFNRLLS